MGWNSKKVGSEEKEVRKVRDQARKKKEDGESKGHKSLTNEVSKGDLYWKYITAAAMHAG